jgi:hypothetical protein
VRRNNTVARTARIQSAALFVDDPLRPVTSTARVQD